MKYVTLKLPSPNDMRSEDIPYAGSVFHDYETGKFKIGDGKTKLYDLPWVTLGVDLSNDSSDKLSITAKTFIENNIEYIENNDYDTFYSHIATPALAQEVTRALLKADLNPKPYLSKIPDSIRHILEPYDVWIEDTTTLYTKTEMDAMLDKWNRELLMQMGVPRSMIMEGN